MHTAMSKLLWLELDRLLELVLALALEELVLELAVLPRAKRHA